MVVVYDFFLLPQRWEAEWNDEVPSKMTSLSKSCHDIVAGT